MIKMLVQSDTMSVVCDECRNQAPKYVPPGSQTVSQPVSTKFEEQKQPEIVSKTGVSSRPSSRLRLSRMNLSEDSSQVQLNNQN